MVNYRCPGNTACQVYNYMDKTARVVFGPDLVILEPHENFNVLSLSGEYNRSKYCTFLQGINLAMLLMSLDIEN